MNKNITFEDRIKALEVAMKVKTFTPTAPIKIVDSVDTFNEWKEIWAERPSFLCVDTETTGLDSKDIYHTGKTEVKTAITVLQYFDGMFNLLINIPKLYDLGLSKALWEFVAEIHESKDIHKVFYNGIFDIKMLLDTEDGIFTEKGYCLMLGANLASRRIQTQSMSLAKVVKQQLDYDMDKSVRLSFLTEEVKKGVWTDEQIKYACDDVEVLAPLYYRVYCALAASNELDAFELDSYALTGSAFFESGCLPVEKELLDSMMEDFNNYEQELLDRKKDLNLSSVNFNSGPQLKELYLKMGIELANTQKDTLALYKDENDTTALVNEWKQRPAKLAEKQDKAHKIKNRAYHEEDGILGFEYNLNQNGAATQRYSTSGNESKVNVQSMDPFTKSTLSAPKGYKIICSDLTAIEVWIMIKLAGQKNMADAIRSGLDVHKFAASVVYGVDFDEVTSEQRSNVKGVVFGLLYGKSTPGLAETLGVSIEKAQEITDTYFNSFSNIGDYMQDRLHEAHEFGYIKLPNGARRYLSCVTPRSKIEKRTQKQLEVKSKQRESKNSVPQGTCALMMKNILGRCTRKINERGLLRVIIPVVTVHDEVAIMAPDEYAQVGHDIIAETMQEVMTEIFGDYLPTNRSEVDVQRQWSKINYIGTVTDFIEGKIDAKEVIKILKKSFGSNIFTTYIADNVSNKTKIKEFFDNYKTTDYPTKSSEYKLKELII